MEPLSPLRLMNRGRPTRRKSCMSVSAQKNLALRPGERGATAGAFHIEDVYPSIECGRYPVKRLAGEAIEVWADIYRSGHDVVAAELIWRKENTSAWQRA